MGGVRMMPRKTVSRWVGGAAQTRSRLAVRRFAAAYDIDLSDAERSLEDYDSIASLFTRRLKDGARPIASAADALVSPVDGRVLSQGPLREGSLLQAKGKTFSISALLAQPDAEARCAEGAYAILYLAPHNYHRIHAPKAGAITEARFIPGDLFPVNPAATARVSSLFARNERVVVTMDTDQGRLHTVLVGATCVGKIGLSFDATLVAEHQRTPIHRGYEAPIAIAAGDELGVFHMGSTVIVATEFPVAWDGALVPESPVRMGAEIGRIAA